MLLNMNLVPVRKYILGHYPDFRDRDIPPTTPQSTSTRLLVD